MSDRTTTSPQFAFNQILSGIVRSIESTEDRETWPAAVRSENVDPVGPSPFAVQVDTAPSTYDEIASLVVPAGRWVVIFRAMHDAGVTYDGIPTGFFLQTQFVQDETVLITQERSTLQTVTEPSNTISAAHGFVVTPVLSTDTTFRILIGASKQYVGATMDWFLRNFAILAFPG